MNGEGKGRQRGDEEGVCPGCSGKFHGWFALGLWSHGILLVRNGYHFFPLDLILQGFPVCTMCVSSRKLCSFGPNIWVSFCGKSASHSIISHDDGDGG